MPNIRNIDRASGTTVDQSASADAARDPKRTGEASPDRGYSAQDVVVKDGALTFPEPKAPLSRDGKLARAKKLLATLRASGQAKLSFGGRIKTGNIDASRSLRNYYPSLDAAKALLQTHPRLSHAVEQFLNGLSVPDDLEEALLGVARSDWPSKAEPPTELGSENNRDLSYYDDVSRVGPATALAVTDDVLRSVIMTNFGEDWGPDLCDWRDTSSPELKLAQARLYARARELGIPVDVSDWNTAASMVPPTPEGAAVLWRLARACDVDPSTVPFAGQTLLQCIATQARDPSTNEAPAKRGPIGTVSCRTSSDALTALKSIEGQAIAFDDATVGRLCGGRFRWDTSLSNYASEVRNKPADFQSTLLSLMARAKELGLNVTLDTDAFQSEIVDLLQGASENAGALRRLCAAFGLPETVFVLGGMPLDQWAAPSADAKPQRQRPTHLPGEDAPAPLGVFGENEYAVVPRRRQAARVLHVEAKELGSLYADFDRTLNRCDPDFFSLADEAILDGWEASTQVDYPWRWLSFWEDPQVFVVQARLMELQGKDGPHAQKVRKPLASWVVPEKYVTSESVPWLARMASAAGVPHDQLKVEHAGSTITLDEHPFYKSLLPEKEKTGVLQASEAILAKLDPSARVKPKERYQALQDLLAGEDPRLELDELLELAIRGRTAGTLAPVDISKLKEAEQDELLSKSIGDWQHLGAMALLAGAFVKAPKHAVARMIKSNGYTAEQADRGAAVAAKLASLDGRALEYALGDLDDDDRGLLFDTLELRIDFAMAKRLDHAKLQSARSAVAGTDPVGFAKLIIDRVLLEKEGSTQQKRLVAYLYELVDKGELERDALQAALTPEAVGLLIPVAEAAADEAVTGYIEAKLVEKPTALRKLIETLGALPDFVEPSAVAERALGQLYQADLANVIPLKEADEKLGGVRATRVARSRRFDDGVKTVEVAGIEIATNDRQDKDVRAVPRKAHSDLVMTPTTEQNLELLATSWRTNKPMLLEGPTSSGKTAAIRYLAWKTESPYRRINLSYHTDVSDLLGRYVGGEERYKKADLEKLSESKLRAIALEYQLDELLGEKALAKLDKAQLIDKVLWVQHEPHWVDGPVVKAMKRGEVLLLDEVNLARPEVLERLNSLFDDDGNLVLTEHRNEVIKPDKNFRFFATMNPASYAGRARLSAAMRSRWETVYAHGLTQSDVTQIVKTLYGSKIPDAELAKLVAVHDNLSRVADEGAIGRKAGGVAFTLRNLFRVAERFVRFRGGELSDDALMRREVEEIYLGGLWEPDDRQHVLDILKTAMPYSGRGFYDNLEIEETDEAIEIGDVRVRKLDTGDNLVPGESSRLVLTARTKQILYRMAKALEMGENVAMTGVRACGKTAMAKMYAMLRGQPYYRQQFSSSTDAMQLIGGYDNRGWKDGLLLQAGRPESVPGIFVGDELNFANPALLERLNPVLDDERKIVLSEKEGEEFRLHPEFRFIAAMNPPTKEYGGRAKLSKAMQNRFTMIFVPDIDTREELLEISKVVGSKLGVAEPVIETVVDLHLWIQESYERGTLGRDVRESDRPELSIRQVLGALEVIAELQLDQGLAQAYLLAVKGYYGSVSEREDAKAIMNKAEEMAA